MEEVKKAAVGQVWRDTYDYGAGTEYAKNPPTLKVTDIDEAGGFAFGIRSTSGRKTRVRLDDKGRVRGYVLVEESK
jgi:hypothetical protein